MPKSGPTPTIELGIPIEFELKNGLRVLMVENHKLPRVSASLLIDNPPLKGNEKNGIYSMTSSMLGKGTKSIPKDTFIGEIDFLGASLNVNAGGAYASSLSRFFPTILEMMADGALNPLFSEDEFEKEKMKILEGIKVNSKNVAQIARRVESILAYGVNHPNGKYTSEASINNISIEDVKLFYKENYIPNNAYLVVIGDFDPNILKKQVKRLFSKWKKGKLNSSTWKSPNEVKELNLNFVDVPNAIQSEVVFQNIVDLSINNPDYFPALVANKILGGGPENRLEQQIREVKGYTYVSRSSIGSSKYTKSRFRAYTSTRFQVTDSAVVELLNEIDKIRNFNVTEKELSDVKAKYVGNFVLASESPSTIANYALNIKTQGLNKDFYKTYLENIDKVTREDVMRVAKKYFQIEKGQIVVTGKGSELIDNLEKVSFKGKIVPISYFDKYGNKVEKPIVSEAPEGLTAKSVLQKYIDAIGGIEKLNSIKSIVLKYQGEAMGSQIINEEKRTNKKMANSTSMNGNVMMKMVITDQEAFVKQGPNKMALPENFHSDLKNSLGIFPELNFLKSSNVKFIGIEDVEGTEAYALQISGDMVSVTLLFDKNTGLKIREISTTNMGGQSQVQESVIGNYKDYSGILLPTEKSQSLGPQSINMTLIDVVLNPELNEEDFN
tara:strand:+ start:1506 stop:3506 length:2001 start_codon:yes stop_codon:yes gene_type:complete